MENAADLRSNTSRLPAIIVLALTASLLVLTVISFIASFFGDWPPKPFTADIGASFFLLLAYIFLGVYALKVVQPQRILLIRSCIWFGLILGTILGAVSLLPVIQTNWNWLGFILMALAIPYLIWSLLNGRFVLPANDLLPGIIILVMALLCLFVYVVIAWWFARRTHRISYGISSAMLMGLISPLMIAVLYTCFMYFPGLFTSPPGYFVARLASFYGLLTLSFVMIFSQVAMALVGGLLGALLGRSSARRVGESSIS